MFISVYTDSIFHKNTTTQTLQSVEITKTLSHVSFLKILYEDDIYNSANFIV